MDDEGWEEPKSAKDARRHARAREKWQEGGYEDGGDGDEMQYDGDGLVEGEERDWKEKIEWMEEDGV